MLEELAQDVGRYGRDVGAEALAAWMTCCGMAHRGHQHLGLKWGYWR